MGFRFSHVRIDQRLPFGEPPAAVHTCGAGAHDDGRSVVSDGPGASPGGGVAGMEVRIVGDGRAGGAFARALAEVGFGVFGPVGRGGDVHGAGAGVDLVVIATPDEVIGDVADTIRSDPDVLVVHLAGARGVADLGAHPRRGVLHPLVSLPDPVTGAARLRDRAWFAIDAERPGDRAVLEGIVDALGGRAIHVPDSRRAAYHAAAVIASNHLVALLGQVMRVAAGAGVPFEAYLDLARQTLGGLVDRSPGEALTGPAARGDWATIRGHLAALDPRDRPAYAALAELAAELAGRTSTIPGWLTDARRGDGGTPREFA